MVITNNESILILDYFNVKNIDSKSKIKNKANDLINKHLCKPIVGKNFQPPNKNNKTRANK
jgi:hypothetical protein